jgi:hypothetical protein
MKRAFAITGLFFFISLFAFMMAAAHSTTFPEGHIFRAAHDRACDTADNAQNSDGVISNCDKAAHEYASAASHESDRLSRHTYLFYEAACLFQVSMSYFNQGDEPTARKYADKSFSILVPLVNEAIFRVGRKDPTKIYSKKELKLIQGMIMVQGQILRMFPEVENGI